MLINRPVSVSPLAPAVALLLIAMASPVAAQPPAQPAPDPVTVPTVIVTAHKEPADAQAVPASVTAVTDRTIANAGIRIVSDAAIFAPNTIYTDFTARKTSNPRVRGIGSSPGNPSVTTYVDGVPHLSSNSSSIELFDIAQIEFVRGPQSSLFGRNALGGIVNVTTARPDLTQWTGSFIAPFGDFGSREVRGSVSGPLGDQVAVGFSLGRQQREGFTTNAVTGNDVDFREGTFGKAQLLWVPSATWETRLIYTGERNRDGDYALTDLDNARRNPFEVSRDFTGYTHRDIHATTLQVRHEGPRVAFTSSTGLVRWVTDDTTDLDYTAVPLATRQNEEESVQFTQEVRLASAANAPLRLSDAVQFKWQTGVVFFTQNYDQLAVNTISPFVLSPFINFPVAQTSPDAALDDRGAAVFGQGTFTIHDRLALTLGARYDHERKEAALGTFYTPMIAPPTNVTAAQTFSDVSPQAALAYHFQPNRMWYVSASRGFKAGGFNPASPAGADVYDQERAWHLESGVKTTLLGGRLLVNTAVFHITWDNLQLNVPNPFVPGQFYISNVGSATSRGAEFELTARPRPGVDVFGSVGVTDARFGRGSLSMGVDVSDNTIPFTPDYTATFGTQLSRDLGRALSIYGRAEATFYGGFKYDDSNVEGQDAYSLANLRVGIRSRQLFVEGWARNAFDTRYVPVAFPYQGFAPSGYVGETGRPRTIGVSVGVHF
ncbi:MAG: TonB-dependent receptor [Vicinamibacterales bacterium]|nr:TonB-dependent receptor [Vicinamibacterales bacterium]